MKGEQTGGYRCSLKRPIRDVPYTNEDIFSFRKKKNGSSVILTDRRLQLFTVDRTYFSAGET